MSEKTFEEGQIIVIEKEFENSKSDLDSTLGVFLGYGDIYYPYKIIEQGGLITLVYKIFLFDDKGFKEDATLIQRIKLYFKLKKLRKHYAKYRM